MITRIRARFPAARQAGFTSVEAVSASLLIVLVAAAVSTAMVIAFRTSTVADQRASAQVAATRLLDGLTANISLADPLQAIADDRLVLTVTTSNSCERHDYLVSSNQNGIPREVRHRVQVTTITALNSCADILSSTWLTIPYSVDREEMLTLADPADGVGLPVFRYYTTGKSQLPVKGRWGAKNNTNPNAAFNRLVKYAIPCRVGQVNITLNVAEGNDKRIYTTTASPLAASMGITPC